MPMIAFSCAGCGMKFSVKDEFAGRSTRCPTCKQPLTVPSPSLNPTRLPSGAIDGPRSSLAQAGLNVGVTLAVPPTQDTEGSWHRPALAALLGQGAPGGQRYLLEGEVGRGGMGAVLRAVDCDIRREVAVKYLLDQGDPGKQVRFVEEAQITGQLDHPNIVPIHELGVDAQKRLFFSMKMVRGRSLAQVLESLRHDPKGAGKQYTLARLLSIFVNVCNALAYAHSRGVIHRDLKPANVMVGDYGEVYVMDWGLAKVLGPAVPTATLVNGPIGPAAALPVADGASGSRPETVMTNRTPNVALTQEGSVLGTPVYMPPEQAEGRIADVGRRSDVYSLGAILYELLTLQPPVERTGGYPEVLTRVITGEILPPEKRAPKRHVPKELSAVVMKALAKERAQRYQSVEELRRDIERFQEGRSVSARDDTRWEAVVKFVKRNKGFSAGSAAALFVLAVVVWLFTAANYRARLRAEEARSQAEEVSTRLLEEQRGKRERGHKSAPLFLRSAQRSEEAKDFDYALAQAEVALEYDPNLAEARLLRA